MHTTPACRRRRRFLARQGASSGRHRDAGQVRGAPGARARRDGRRLRRLRPADQAPGRAEDDPARAPAQRGCGGHARAIPPGGPGGRAAVTPQHRPDLRLRRGGRAVVHRDGVRRGARAQGELRRERALPPDRRRAHHGADSRRARLLAPPGRGPPRHQAGEHLPAGRRKREGRRLRHRPRRVVEPDAGGLGARHAELHVARADPRTARRRALGPVLGRRRPLPVPDRRAALHRLGRHDDAKGAAGRPVAALHAQRSGAPGHGRRRAQSDGQAGRGAFSERGGVRRRDAGRGGIDRNESGERRERRDDLDRRDGRTRGGRWEARTGCDLRKTRADDRRGCATHGRARCAGARPRASRCRGRNHSRYCGARRGRVSPEAAAQRRRTWGADRLRHRIGARRRVGHRAAPDRRRQAGAQRRSLRGRVRPLRPRHPRRPPPRPPPLPPALPATRSRPSPSRRRAHRSSRER